MNLFPLILRSARHSPVRAALTILAVAVTLVAFLLLRSISAGWTNQIEQTPNNRVVSRHKIGWGQAFPMHYAEEVRKLPGVRHAMGGRWADVKYPANDKVFFFITAVQARPFVDMHYELEAPTAQKEAWVARRGGAMVSAELAETLGWQLGDTLHFDAKGFSAAWDLEVVSIVRSTRHGFGQRDVWMHFEYYNEKLPLDQRDQLNIISAEIEDPNQGANLARAIDIHFDERDNQTYTQEDQALNASFVGMFDAILRALDLVSLLVLGVTLLLLGNTVAMGARERTREYGVLRALGFLPRDIRVIVLGEAALLGLCGGVLGVVLSFPLIETALSRFLEEQMEFDPLHVPMGTAVIALVLGALLGLVAAALPARRASQLETVEALRRID